MKTIFALIVAGLFALGLNAATAPEAAPADKAATEQAAPADKAAPAQQAPADAAAPAEKPAK